MYDYRPAGPPTTPPPLSASAPSCVVLPTAAHQFKHSAPSTQRSHKDNTVKDGSNRVFDCRKTDQDSRARLIGSWPFFAFLLQHCGFLSAADDELPNRSFRSSSVIESKDGGPLAGPLSPPSFIFLSARRVVYGSATRHTHTHSNSHSQNLKLAVLPAAALLLCALCAALCCAACCPP